MAKKYHTALSGRQFTQLVREELRARNSGLGRISTTELSKQSGLSARYLRGLLADDNPNPSVLSMRLVMFTLGLDIPNPEQDVIPHLKKKGVFNPLIHGRRRAEVVK
jgi:hypothetical protein